MLWRVRSQASSLSGSEPMSHDRVQPYTALTRCPVSWASRSAQRSAAKDSSEPSTPTMMSAMVPLDVLSVMMSSSTKSRYVQHIVIRCV